MNSQNQFDLKFLRTLIKTHISTSESKYFMNLYAVPTE